MIFHPQWYDTRAQSVHAWRVLRDILSEFAWGVKNAKGCNYANDSLIAKQLLFTLLQTIFTIQGEKYKTMVRVLCYFLAISRKI